MGCQSFRVTGNNESVSMAVELFKIIEQNGFDSKNGGYYSTFSEDWKPSDGLMLSSNDINAAKSANTHLHILDAYTNLYRVYSDGLLNEKIFGLIRLIIEKMYDKSSGHLKLYFNENWIPVSDIISFGQSISASRLIYKAAEILDDKELKELAGNVSLK